MCVLVIGCRRPRLHLEKILILSSTLLNHKHPTGDTGFTITDCRRKHEESEAVVCLSARVSEGRISTIANMSREGGGGDDLVNLWPQRRERGGWSWIELRILDSRVPRKASIRARTASAPGRARRLQQHPTSQHHRRRSSRPAAERFPKTGSLWADREGRANQGACRAVCSCSGPLLFPHSRVYSIYSVLLLEPKLLLFHGVSFQRLVFCLVKSCVT